MGDFNEFILPQSCLLSYFNHFLIIIKFTFHILVDLNTTVY